MKSKLRQLKERGLLFTAATIFNRIVPEWLFRYSHLVFYTIDSNSFPSQQLLPDGEATIDWADAKSADSEVRRMTYCNPGADSDNLFAVAARVDGHLAGGFWAVKNSIDEHWLGIRLQLESNQAWLFAARVSGEFRRRGIHTKVLRFLSTNLNRQGFDYQVLAVNPHNTASRNAHEKYASASLGSTKVIRLLGITWCRATDRITCDRAFTWNCRKHPILVQFK